MRKWGIATVRPGPVFKATFLSNGTERLILTAEMTVLIKTIVTTIAKAAF